MNHGRKVDRQLLQVVLESLRFGYGMVLRLLRGGSSVGDIGALIQHPGNRWSAEEGLAQCWVHFQRSRQTKDDVAARLAVVRHGCGIGTRPSNVLGRCVDLPARNGSLEALDPPERASDEVVRAKQVSGGQGDSGVRFARQRPPGPLSCRAGMSEELLAFFARVRQVALRQ